MHYEVLCTLCIFHCAVYSGDFCSFMFLLCSGHLDKKYENLRSAQCSVNTVQFPVNSLNYVGCTVCSVLCVQYVECSVQCVLFAVSVF